MIDTHCHLTHFKQPEKELDLAREKGVIGVVVPCVHPKEWERVLRFSENHSDVWCALGIHPMEAHHIQASDLKRLQSLLHHPNVVAIGEIGLDSYFKESLSAQNQVFQEQLKIADQFNLPVILHQRKSLALVIQALKQFPKLSVLHHAWSSNMQLATQWEQIQGHFGIGGAVTFPNQKKLTASIHQKFLDQIQFETDSPYIQVHFGRERKDSAPCLLPVIAKKVSQILQLSFKETTRIATNNSIQFFQLPLEI
ncbi:MAG: TatD DNase family protein [bacterium]